jgi:thioredoxin 1
VEELAADLAGKAKVGKIDVDACPETASKYEIMSVPTLIIFKNGEAVQRFTGLQGKEALKKELEKLI